MASIEERFAMIQKSVMDQAGAEAQKLLDQAKEYKESAMKKAEADVLQELYSRIQDEVAEIHTSATRSVSQKESKERQDLLLRREEITRSVFEQVKRRLLDFTKTPAYNDLMTEIAKELGVRCHAHAPWRAPSLCSGGRTTTWRLSWGSTLAKMSASWRTRPSTSAASR